MTGNTLFQSKGWTIFELELWKLAQYYRDNILYMCRVKRGKKWGEIEFYLVQNVQKARGGRGHGPIAPPSPRIRYWQIFTFWSLHDFLESPLGAHII